MNHSKQVYVDTGSKPPLRKTFILDVLRGVAALYVLIGHARWLLWEGYSEGFKLHSEMYDPFHTILVYGFSVFGFGHQAVMLFFVLSGFVIHYSSIHHYQKTDSFSVSSYLYKRFKRIYPPFIIALLLTFLLDTIGTTLGYSIYTSTTAFPIINLSIHSDLSWHTLVGNVCMLQTLYSPVFGSNGPLWSLMYEWWFYMLYIPIFFINKQHPLFTVLLLGGMFILALFIPVSAFKWITVLHYFFAWYLGVIAADWYMGRLDGIKKRILLFVYLFGVFAFATYLMGFSYMVDYYLAAGFVVFMYLSLKCSASIMNFKTLLPLSDFSYTLYVIHLPILVLMSGWLQNRMGGALPMHFGYVLVGIVVCLFIGWTVHFLVEKPSKKH